MKITLAIVIVTLTVFLAAALASNPQNEALKVVYNLTGSLQSLENKELAVTFSDDMLPLGGQRDGAALVTITPAVKGEFTWRGNRTLAFRPEPRFRYSTTYTAVIPAGTRSLSGKTLPEEIRWQWSTPLAYPVEVRAASQEYFSNLAPKQKLDFEFWVKDSLILRFNQPVSAPVAKDFFVLKEAKSGARAQVRLIQKAVDAIEVQYAKDLLRGMLYQFMIKKGFCGSEGSTGTNKEFSFTYNTVPAFQYSGKQDLVLFPDEPHCWLSFSNQLDEIQDSLVKVFKMSGEKKTPLKFILQPRYYDMQGLLLNINEDLASGDTLLIQVDRNLSNIYKEPLAEDLELEARVCSSRSPRLHFSLQDKKPLMTAKSMKQADVHLFKFKPDFYSQLANRNFGILQQKGFQDEFIEKEILQKLVELPERPNSPVLRDDELGSPLGFFGFLVTRYEPYNICRDIALMRLPASMLPRLEVFHRRNMDMVIKASRDQTLYWLYDNRSGKGVARKPIFLKPSQQDAFPVGETDGCGILTSSKKAGKADLILAKNPENGDMALARADEGPISDREVRITVFSDRDFYKPGDTIHIAGIVKECASGRIASPRMRTAALEIIGPDWQNIKTDRVQLDSLGGFQYDFKSDPAGKKGRHRIQVKVQDGAQWRNQHDITIDHYQPNTLQINISNVAGRYLFGETFRPEISGSFLAGNPMAGDKFIYRLQLTQAYSKVFTAGSLGRYGFSLDRDLARNDPPIQGEKELDKKGRHALAIPMSSFAQTNYLANIDFSATGRSAEGKEYTARTRPLFFPGNMLAGIRVDYSQSAKEKINAELALVDPQGKPMSGEVRVSLYREVYQDHQRKLNRVAGPEDVYIDRRKTHSFRVQEAGRYVLRCDAPDSVGRVVSTSGYFFAWDTGYSDRDDHLRIESEQTTLRIGEKLKCFVHSPREGHALVTIERGSVLDSRIIELQKMTPLEIPVKKEYFPAIRVSVVAMFEHNASEETSREFQISDEGKTLRIELESPAEIKPARKARVNIHLRDNQRKGARAKLFVYAVDEGNLSLRGYRTPDPHGFFFYSDPLAKDPIRTYYSKNFTRWTFQRPIMDIDLKQPAIFGCVFKPDATPLAGAIVTLEDEKHKKLKTAITSAQGYYQFSGMTSGRYAVKAEAKGFWPFLQSDIYFDGRNHRPCELALIPASTDKNWDEAKEFGMEEGVAGGVLGGVMSAPMAAEMKSVARMKGEKDAEHFVDGVKIAEVDISGIRVRSNFKEVLFFETAETDEMGEAAVDFTSSDQLSTYRIMAVAYGEDSFGKTEKQLVVSKDLLISEAMPEFARQGDEFSAGVQLSNRTAQTLPVTLLAKPEGITIKGQPQLRRALDARGNGLFQFPFLADRLGEAKIDFYAVSTADRDGLQKKLPVTDCLVMETLIDFASGRSLKKMIEPQADAENQVVTIKAAPSLLRPAVNIAKKLVFYPYECLEQRTSKVMPFLALSPQLAERLELGLEQGQIRESVDGFLKIIPEFMSSDGALSYYRGGRYTSDYLTAYVLWALHLARERDYKVDPQLVQKLAGYLQRASLDRTTENFYLFVLSLGKQADSKKLKKMAAERDGLSLPARVFLYRALHNQGMGKELLSAMLNEFNTSLQVEADFAYFDVREFSYNRDFPFYSSRFATALLLQAVLEVEGGHVLAERIIRWLLEGEPTCWNTTQTNFWILCAMDEYLAQVEKTTARKAEIVLLGEKTAREFANSRDMLLLSKRLEDRKEPVEATITADQPVYVTSELTYQLARAGKKSRGIDIQRNVYNEKGETVNGFQRGQTYMVELLIKADKEVPYGVIDEPLAAGFELLRQDIATTRPLREFNTKHSPVYRSPWARQENAADRLVFYTYSMQGPLRIVYFIKAMYAGCFTWMPAVAQGMYHPQYVGRTAMRTIEVRE
jgi:uncharacterized protein YfaS (alpha-2-macroglobulin family)